MSRGEVGSQPSREERRPGRLLPVLYFALGHLCLLLALAVPTLLPRTIAGFFYHSRMLAVVHLITLGWITASILGALYLILPMAFKAPLPEGRGDFWAFGAFALGSTGLASHFWIDEVSGMALSAALVVGAALWVSARAARALAPAAVPGEVKAHFYLAFLNLALAGLLGTLLGLDKWIPFWSASPGISRLDRVFAHAHLAALGWALMMVMGAACRLLPMFLPAIPPRGRWVWASALTLEAGALGLGGGWLFHLRPLILAGALSTAAAVAIFLLQVIRMGRHRLPAPPAMPRPDLGMLHVPLAFLWLLTALGLGLTLLLGEVGEWKLRAVMAYGTFALVGFLAQMVVGIGSRLIPLYAFLRVPRTVGERPSVPTPFHFGRPGVRRRIQGVILLLWTAGVPALALGLAFDRLTLLRLGALALLSAAAIEAVDWARMLRAG